MSECRLHANGMGRGQRPTRHRRFTLVHRAHTGYEQHGGLPVVNQGSKSETLVELCIERVEFWCIKRAAGTALSALVSLIRELVVAYAAADRACQALLNTLKDYAAQTATPTRRTVVKLASCVCCLAPLSLCSCSSSLHAFCRLHWL